MFQYYLIFIARLYDNNNYNVHFIVIDRDNNMGLSIQSLINTPFTSMRYSRIELLLFIVYRTRKRVCGVRHYVFHTIYIYIYLYINDKKNIITYTSPTYVNVCVCVCVFINLIWHIHAHAHYDIPNIIIVIVRT